MREFKIIAQNEFTKQYVEANQMHICDLMEKIVGRRLKLVCRTENQRRFVSDQDVLNLAQRGQCKVGLDVKVE